VTNFLLGTSTLAAALSGFVLIESEARANVKRPDKLTLKSGYSGKVLIDRARRVSLSVTLDGKGSGWGVLTFDPNFYEGGTATQIAIEEISIQLRLVADEAKTAKGRRVYELKRTASEGKVEEGVEHWFLVRPLKEGMPHWLVFVDKDGRFRDVLMLE